MRFYSWHDSIKTQEYFDSFFTSPSFHFFNKTLNFIPFFHCKKLKKRLTKWSWKFNFNHTDELSIIYWNLLFQHFKRSPQYTIDNFDLKDRYTIMTKFGYYACIQLLS